MRNELKEFLDFALSLGELAATTILPYYQCCEVEAKADGSEVTEADRQAELVLRERVAERYPGHSFLGEEFGAVEQGSEYQWIIDPIDGTTWFSLGLPRFGTLIALMRSGQPVVGVVHMPIVGETVYAAQGSGCWFKTRERAPVQVRVAAGVPLERALLSASGLHATDFLDSELFSLSPIVKGAAKFRFCGDCWQHALVCRGAVHAAIDTIMQPWDTAALVPCILEAGGALSDLAGARADVTFSGSLVTACSQELLDHIVDLGGS